MAFCLRTVSTSCRLPTGHVAWFSPTSCVRNCLRQKNLYHSFSSMKPHDSECFLKLSNKFTHSAIRCFYDKSQIVKDVLLFRCNRSTIFYFIGAFAASQGIFWVFLTNTAFTTMRDSEMINLAKYGEEGPPAELKNWSSWSGFQNQVSSRAWRYGITFLCIASGTLIFSVALLVCKRSIHSIYLRKGGNDLTFVTYGYFGLRRAFTIPVIDSSCEFSRHSTRTILPIKIRGKKFFYMLPLTEGTFHNGRLFDVTAGLKRGL